MDPRHPAHPFTVAPMPGTRLDIEAAADAAARSLAGTHTIVALAAAAALGLAVVCAWAELAGRSCGSV